MSTDSDYPPNCSIVNCARTEKVACYASSLWEMKIKASNWFNKGPVALEKIVLERNGKLLETEEEFLNLPVKDTFVYLNFLEKWEEAPPNVVEKLEAKLFYDRRPKPEVPKGIPKRIVGFYRDLVDNDAFKKEEAWESFKVLTLQAIMCADLELLKKFVKPFDNGTLELIKDKAWDLYCLRNREINRWDDPDFDLDWPTGEEELLTSADVDSEADDSGVLAAA